MNKNIIAILICLLLVPSADAQRGKLVQKLMAKRLEASSAENTGPVPDYGNLSFWAASPFKHDNSDSIPAFLANEPRDQRADVFFIHPTSFSQDVKDGAWNADLTDATLNSQTDSRSILYQASVFNGSCRVFAPRYRQANLKAFFIRTTPAAQKAFDLAYSDVKQAFEYYLTHYNNHRPIIIASHSQGSLHVIRLLQEYFDGKPLQKQLVCAYVIGYQIPKTSFKSIPLGKTADATGCVVGWRSYQKGEIPAGVKAEKDNSLCVNPLTWTDATSPASSKLNHGSLMTFNLLRNLGPAAEIEPSSHILWVELPDNVGEKIKSTKNLHVYDYNLFWMNIRENVKMRINAFEKARK
ncbi:DUF3089 domain-containing protein [Paludibacter jiangxiensis]|uniref:DUF3089 domain-containing protein n=1 Tax=Paludibacter jiangxiensis TaxID=681398 RepID=A0A171AH67_9BACT|nr:DUF3089 domain-containing protein [Paludibacter jiangxiensis]GAT63721.1 hypothetical protein PJIAN_4262 [Paludibacter jiangxiensis]